MEELLKTLEEIKEWQMNHVQLARTTEVYKFAEKAQRQLKILNIPVVSGSLLSNEEIEAKAKEVIPEDLYKDCGGYVTIEDRNKDKRNLLIEGINIGVRWRQ